MGARVFFLLTAVVGSITAQLVELSCDDIMEFVDGHNSMRELVVTGNVDGQPAATEMSSVVWDEELAEKAAQWLLLFGDTTPVPKNYDNTIPSGRFTTGENVYEFVSEISDEGFKPEIALDSWFSTAKNYTFGPISDEILNGPNYELYTQMVWMNTEYIGCAISEWIEYGQRRTVVVCNYGPAGNVIGETPYQEGELGGSLSCNAKNNNCDHPYGNECQ